MKLRYEIMVDCTREEMDGFRGGFKIGFHTEIGCRPRFIVSPVVLIWMASMVLHFQ